jgi:hypothetical protein
MSQNWSHEAAIQTRKAVMVHNRMETTPPLQRQKALMALKFTVASTKSVAVEQMYSLKQKQDLGVP